MSKMPPIPWRVYEGKLRPQYSTRIIEIVDADGEPVIPWRGFDASDRSFAERRRIAHLIVTLVNDALRPTPIPDAPSHPEGDR